MCNNLACLSGNCIEPAPNGLENQILTMSGGVPSWAHPDGSGSTAICDRLICVKTSGGVSVVPHGADGQILTMKAGLPVWVGGGEPDTAACHQLACLATDSCLQRMPPGTDGQVVTIVGGVPVWSDGGVPATLPCADGDCFEVRVSAQNPNATRQNYSDDGFSRAAILAGGQTFAVEGHPAASVTMTGAGNFRSTTPLIVNPGPSAAYRIRTNDGETATLTLTFSEPVCGAFSFALNIWGGGSNPSMTATGISVVGDRSDLAPGIIWTDNGGGNYGGVWTGSQSYGLAYFDNATEVTMTAAAGELAFGFYALNACGNEAKLLHCPTPNEFYRWDGTAWVLDGSIAAIGEWLPAAC